MFMAKVYEGDRKFEGTLGPESLLYCIKVNAKNRKSGDTKKKNTRSVNTPQTSIREQREKIG